ncbi:MAG: phosphatase PAP2 family protein [Candidatus Altiarchaeota archaeon]
MFSRKDVAFLTATALLGIISYITGLDYYLASTISNRAAHGVSLFFSFQYYVAFMVLSTLIMLVKNRRAAVSMVVSVTLVFLIQGMFTEFAPRARPSEAMLIGAGLMHLIQSSGTSSSFFSGHTASSMVVYVTYMMAGHHPAAMLVLAAPIMASRIMLVQHYLSDVLGGIIFGYVTAKVAYTLVVR